MASFKVVLVEPEFEESVGFVARVMKNFGLQHLILVSPRVKVGSVARTKAVHAQEVLDSLQTFSSLREAIEGVDVAVGTTAQPARSLHRILRRPATPREFAENIGAAHGSVALIFGREGTGLTNEELDLCDATLTIPTSANYATMNISHASTVVFYELFIHSQTTSRELLASETAKKACVEFLGSAALSAGLSAMERGLAVRALRNIMGRSAVRTREASSMAGAFRKIADCLTAR